MSADKDEVIHILRATDSGWCAGPTDSGKSGYIPSVYLKPITPATKRKLSSSVIPLSQDPRKSFRRDAISHRSSMALRHSAR